jgi:hypothetical protein
MANTRPPLSVDADVTATAVTMAADVANSAPRWDPAVNSNTEDGGVSEHVYAKSSCRVRHLERRKISSACVFRGSELASEQGTAQGDRVLEWPAWGHHEAVLSSKDAGCTSAVKLQEGEVYEYSGVYPAQPIRSGREDSRGHGNVYGRVCVIDTCEDL